MAGVIGRSGANGKTLQDRQRTAGVRNLALDHIEKILSPKYKDKKYQKEMLLRLAPNLLPRLNAGRDDEERLFPEPILSRVLEAHVSSHHGDTQDIEPQ